MKKIYLPILTVIICLSLSAQDAKTVFANVPDSITPLLTAVNRADFIDFLESNMKAEVKNKFDEVSEMTDLTETFINIRLTDKVTWQMKLLPWNDSKIVCVVTTSCAPVCDSRIQFYTTDWKELPANDYITLPREDDFYLTPADASDEKYAELRRESDIYLLKGELAKDSDTVTLTYTTPEYISNTDQIDLAEYIRTQAVLRWDGMKFVSE